jgi:galactokinase
LTTRAGLIATLAERFADQFGDRAGMGLALAPGRVNLIGEHTDYNEGWVLPMAIARHVGVAFRQRADRRLRAHAVAFGETQEVDLDLLQPPGEGGWISYVAGMAWAMLDAGLELQGIDCVIDGNVPLGSGLSSSAALEMATARALCAAAEGPWRPKEMARLGQRADNVYVGVSSGPMDQLASAAAEPGCALLVDCRSLETEAVPFPGDAAIVVMDTGSRRALVASAYNERRDSCRRAVEAVRHLQPEVRALRDVDEELLEAARARMDATTYRRSAHVVAENLRPHAFAEALRQGDLPLAGQLMDDSHASLRDLYEVSSPELDRITELARSQPACFGARLTGAGFGGCAVALVATGGEEAFIEAVHPAYRTEFDLESEFFVCEPVAGARLSDPPAGTDAEPPDLVEE